MVPPKRSFVNLGERKTTSLIRVLNVREVVVEVLSSLAKAIQSIVFVKSLTMIGGISTSRLMKHRCRSNRQLDRLLFVGHHLYSIQ